MNIPPERLDAAFDAIYGINRRLWREIAPGLALIGFIFAVIFAACIFGGAK